MPYRSIYEQLDALQQQVSRQEAIYNTVDFLKRNVTMDEACAEAATVYDLSPSRVKQIYYSLRNAKVGDSL